MDRATRDKLILVLNDVKKYLRRGWTQGIPARDSAGNDLNFPLHPDGCCWCLTGACLIACYGGPTLYAGNADLDYGRYLPAVYETEQLADIFATVSRHAYNCIEDWNDAPGRTKAEVIRLVGRTIRHLHNIHLAA